MPSPESVVSDLDHLLATARAEQGMPSVSACVFRDGEIVWERALGLADMASGRAATSDDVYRVGSITKDLHRGADRAVRDESGAVTKLYFVTYPLTLEPSTFA